MQTKAKVCLLRGGKPWNFLLDTSVRRRGKFFVQEELPLLLHALGSPGITGEQYKHRTTALQPSWAQLVLRAYRLGRQPGRLQSGGATTTLFSSLLQGASPWTPLIAASDLGGRIPCCWDSTAFGRDERDRSLYSGVRCVLPSSAVLCRHRPRALPHSWPELAALRPRCCWRSCCASSGRSGMAALTRLPASWSPSCLGGATTAACSPSSPPTSPPCVFAHPHPPALRPSHAADGCWSY